MKQQVDCYDNAMMASLWATLKKKLVQHAKFKTHAQARSAIFEWIEVCYQRERSHSSLGYLSPEAFEAARRVGSYKCVSTKSGEIHYWYLLSLLSKSSGNPRASAPKPFVNRPGVIFVWLILRAIGLMCIFFVVSFVIGLLVSPPIATRCSGAVLVVTAWFFTLGLGREASSSGAIPQSLVVLYHFAPAFSGMLMLLTGDFAFVVILPLLACIGFLMIFGWFTSFGYYFVPIWVGFKFGAIGLTAFTSDTWPLYIGGGVIGIFVIALYCGIVHTYLSTRAASYGTNSFG